MDGDVLNFLAQPKIEKKWAVENVAEQHYENMKKLPLTSYSTRDLIAMARRAPQITDVAQFADNMRKMVSISIERMNIPDLKAAFRATGGVEQLVSLLDQKPSYEDEIAIRPWLKKNPMGELINAKRAFEGGNGIFALISAIADSSTQLSDNPDDIPEYLGITLFQIRLTLDGLQPFSEFVFPSSLLQDQEEVKDETLARLFRLYLPELHSVQIKANAIQEVVEGLKRLEKILQTADLVIAQIKDTASALGRMSEPFRSLTETLDKARTFMAGLREKGHTQHRMYQHDGVVEEEGVFEEEATVFPREEEEAPREEEDKEEAPREEEDKEEAPREEEEAPWEEEKDERPFEDESDYRDIDFKIAFEMFNENILGLPSAWLYAEPTFHLLHFDTVAKGVARNRRLVDAIQKAVNLSDTANTRMDDGKGDTPRQVAQACQEYSATLEVAHKELENHSYMAKGYNRILQEFGIDEYARTLAIESELWTRRTSIETECCVFNFTAQTLRVNTIANIAQTLSTRFDEKMETEEDGTVFITVNRSGHGYCPILHESITPDSDPPILEKFNQAKITFQFGLLLERLFTGGQFTDAASLQKMSEIGFRLPPSRQTTTKDLGIWLRKDKHTMARRECIVLNATARAIETTFETKCGVFVIVKSISMEREDGEYLKEFIQTKTNASFVPDSWVTRDFSSEDVGNDVLPLSGGDASANDTIKNVNNILTLMKSQAQVYIDLKIGDMIADATARAREAYQRASAAFSVEYDRNPTSMRVGRLQDAVDETLQSYNTIRGVESAYTQLTASAADSKTELALKKLRSLRLNLALNRRIDTSDEALLQNIQNYASGVDKKERIATRNFVIFAPDVQPQFDDDFTKQVDKVIEAIAFEEQGDFPVGHTYFDEESLVAFLNADTETKHHVITLLSPNSKSILKPKVIEKSTKRVTFFQPLITSAFTKEVATDADASSLFAALLSALRYTENMNAFTYFQMVRKFVIAQFTPKWKPTMIALFETVFNMEPDQQILSALDRAIEDKEKTFHMEVVVKSPRKHELIARVKIAFLDLAIENVAQHLIVTEGSYIIVGAPLPPENTSGTLVLPLEDGDNFVKTWEEAKASGSALNLDEWFKESSDIPAVVTGAIGAFMRRKFSWMRLFVLPRETNEDYFMSANAQMESTENSVDTHSTASDVHISCTHLNCTTDCVDCFDLVDGVYATNSWQQFVTRANKGIEQRHQLASTLAQIAKGSKQQLDEQTTNLTTSNAVHDEAHAEITLGVTMSQSDITFEDDAHANALSAKTSVNAADSPVLDQKELVIGEFIESATHLDNIVIGESRDDTRTETAVIEASQDISLSLESEIDSILGLTGNSVEVQAESTKAVPATQTGWNDVSLTDDDWTNAFD